MKKESARVRFVYEAAGEHRIEAHLEIPLWISAEELRGALESAFACRIGVLWAEAPAVLLQDGQTLGKLGIRHGTTITGRETAGDVPVRDRKEDLLRKGYPRFIRNTRIRTVIDEADIEILDPPDLPDRRKENWLLRLLPSLGMLVAAGAMAMIGTGRMILFSGITGTVAILSTIIMMVRDRKSRKEQEKSRIETYQDYIANKRREIERLRDKEKQDLEKVYISLEEDVKRVMAFSPSLFDRTAEDEDFLCARLGSGAVKARRQVSYRRQEKLEVKDSLARLPEQTQKLYRFIPDAPVAIDLKEINALGITGKEADRFEILKAMVIDLCTRQYYSDVRLILAAGEKTASRVEWARYLPHVFCEEMGIPAIVTGEEHKAAVFEYLYKELSAREQAKSFDHRVVVFFYEAAGLMTHPVSRFIGKAKELGVTFVFFTDVPEEAPVGCQYILQVCDREGAWLIPVSDRSKAIYVFYPRIGTAEAERIATKLAPVYTEEVSLDNALPQTVSLFDILKIRSVDELDIQELWSRSDVTRSMAAPLGLSKKGFVELDLSDRAHGPHGLVAGTTGSGKSEILQTYILSMATRFHPYEIGFVIIDFKGGGMAGQLKGLPHLVGTITNIDEHEVSRSLRSIRAELQKRQHLFSQAGVNHIDRYIEKYKAGGVREPLPHLVIIVDEFAELKAQQPDFMKELISAARIGRSLGVHLILATQKPAGQVSEQIWSNSHFRICLKVQGKEDSNEVLKSPLAAEIREAGRAYLQVGNNEIFELFQSAYSGGLASSSPGGKEYTVYQFTSKGKRMPVYEKKILHGSEQETQLEAAVRQVRTYCEAEKIKKLTDICLPVLPEVIPYMKLAGDMPQEAARAGVLCPIGIYDDPDHQYQGVYSIELGRQNTMIIGSSQSGKTNLLQTVIRGLSSRYSPEEVNLYVIDFASMNLKSFESLPQIGGVVTPGEDEKLKNLFKLLSGEITKRKEKLLESGISSFAAYRETGQCDLPLIVLLIDNLTGLRELYLQESDELPAICREGIQAGICVIAANTQTQGIGYRYLSAFSCRIALFCHDAGEYSALFNYCRIRPEHIPGRALVEIEKLQLECQIFQVFEGEKEAGRSSEIQKFMEQENQRYPDIHAPKIPVIPETLTSRYIRENYSLPAPEPFEIVAGLDYETVQPLMVNLANTGTMAFCGGEKGIQYRFIQYLLRAADESFPGRIEVRIVDDAERKLGSLQKESFTKAYSLISSDACRMAREMEEVLKERYEEMLKGNIDVLSESPLLVFLLKGTDAIEAIQTNGDALTAYRNIIGRYRNLNVCILLMVENQPIPFGAPEILKTVKEKKHLFFFDDLSILKIFDLPLSELRAYKKPLAQGDGFYIKENEVVKIKIPY